MCLDLAGRLMDLAEKEKIRLIFKASYDKANRTSHKAFRGPGLKRGLEVLAAVKAKYGMPIITDVHQVSEVEPAAEVADVLQLPAFLSRQTDLVLALGESGRVVNLKKGQFLAPWDMKPVVEKVLSTGNKKIILTERGVSFGYNNLVADMRSILAMKELGFPVVFDATHSVQLPGGAGNATTGDGKWAPHLAKAATAVGCDGLFLETHVNPMRAKSDKDNAIPFRALGKLWRQCKEIHDTVS